MTRAIQIIQSTFRVTSAQDQQEIPLVSCGDVTSDNR